MDFDLGDDVDALRRELRQLVEERIPPDFLGALTDDPGDLDTAQEFCRVLADRGLLCMAWPEGWPGRRRGSRLQARRWRRTSPRRGEYMV